MKSYFNGLNSIAEQNFININNFQNLKKKFLNGTIKEEDWKHLVEQQVEIEERENNAQNN